MKMFTAWMEVLANVGVLAGIVFLTIEVSQNTLAAKSEASLAIQTEISKNISQAVNSPQLFDAVFKAYQDEALNDRETLMLSFAWHSTLTMMEGALLQYELGVIDTNVLDSFDSELCMLTRGTAFSRWNWRNQGRGFSPQMQAHVAELSESACG